MIKLDVYVLSVKYSYDDTPYRNFFVLSIHQTMEGAQKAAQRRHELYTSITTPIAWSINEVTGWAASNQIKNTEYTIERMGVQQ